MKEKLHSIGYPMNDHNKGAISMLELIAKNEGWEESKEFYLKKFFK